MKHRLDHTIPSIPQSRPKFANRLRLSLLDDYNSSQPTSVNPFKKPLPVAEMADALLAQVQEVFEGQIVHASLTSPLRHPAPHTDHLLLSAGFRGSETNGTVYNHHSLCHWCMFLSLTLPFRHRSALLNYLPRSSQPADSSTDPCVSSGVSAAEYLDYIVDWVGRNSASVLDGRPAVSDV